MSLNFKAVYHWYMRPCNNRQKRMIQPFASATTLYLLGISAESCT